MMIRKMGKISGKKRCAFASNRLLSMMPPAVGVNEIVRSTSIEPPLWKEKLEGRSKCVHSVVTGGLVCPFAWYFVPDAPLRSLICSSDLAYRVPFRSLRIYD